MARDCWWWINTGGSCWTSPFHTAVKELNWSNFPPSRGKSSRKTHWDVHSLFHTQRAHANQQPEISSVKVWEQTMIWRSLSSFWITRISMVILFTSKNQERLRLYYPYNHQADYNWLVSPISRLHYPHVKTIEFFLNYFYGDLSSQEIARVTLSSSRFSLSPHTSDPENFPAAKTTFTRPPAARRALRSSGTGGPPKSGPCAVRIWKSQHPWPKIADLHWDNLELVVRTVGKNCCVLF